jgi:hypothetical protein
VTQQKLSLSRSTHAAERSSAHTCHARGCNVHVPPEMLMCLAHWRRVPLRIKRAVWKTYRSGQCDDMNVSRKWLEAASAAIGSVACAEGLGVTEREREAMEALG